MEPKVRMTRRIGSTVYKVRIYFTGDETMEEKILRLVREKGMDYDGKSGIMTVPQMSREPERRSA